jgi:isopenicillin N synthase-like dioxygenase
MPLEGQLRYGEHTDYTGYTILKCFDESEHADLQIKIGEEWVRCKNVQNSFIINSGDMIEVWTNGIFKSNYHRVLNPIEKYNKSRISLVFFTGPHDDTMIECLETCDKEHAKYKPVKSGDYLKMKINSSNEKKNL